MSKQINTTNWEVEFDKKFTAFENVYADKQELKQFIKDLLASSQKEKEVELSLQKTKLIEEVEKLPTMTITNPEYNHPANAYKLIDKSEVIKLLKE